MKLAPSKLPHSAKSPEQKHVNFAFKLKFMMSYFGGGASVGVVLLVSERSDARNPGSRDAVARHIDSLGSLGAPPRQHFRVAPNKAWEVPHLRAAPEDSLAVLQSGLGECSTKIVPMHIPDYGDQLSHWTNPSTSCIPLPSQPKLDRPEHESNGQRSTSQLCQNHGQRPSRNCLKWHGFAYFWRPGTP